MLPRLWGMIAIYAGQEALREVPTLMSDGAESFTVLITNYNDARYLPVALEAILSQTPGPDQVIVADDGSTDDSVSVIEAWANRHEVIEVVRSPKNIVSILAIECHIKIRQQKVRRGQVNHVIARTGINCLEVNNTCRGAVCSRSETCM